MCSISELDWVNPKLAKDIADDCCIPCEALLFVGPGALGNVDGSVITMALPAFTAGTLTVVFVLDLFRRSKLLVTLLLLLLLVMSEPGKVTLIGELEALVPVKGLPPVGGLIVAP